MSSELAQPGLTNHEEGVPTRRAEFREFARKIVNDKEYQENLLARMRSGDISPAVERLLLEASYCSVKVDEQGGSDELKRSSEMRAAVDAMLKSGRAVELDHQVVGARRVLRLKENVPIERPPDGDGA